MHRNNVGSYNGSTIFNLICEIISKYLIFIHVLRNTINLFIAKIIVNICMSDGRYSFNSNSSYSKLGTYYMNIITLCYSHCSNSYFISIARLILSTSNCEYRYKAIWCVSKRIYIYICRVSWNGYLMTTIGHQQIWEMYYTCEIGDYLWSIILKISKPSPALYFNW